ncbi:acetyl-CoA hydrolase [Bacteroidia bacterium]|nr:acetyl-CoA hydrolase [Bacteroidia bacterium]
MSYKKLSAEEAASLINNDDIISLSGFTATGCPKAVPTAIAARAEAEHAAGRPFKVGMYTGASTGESADGCLSRAHAIKFRTPYQSNKDSRTALNNHEMEYFDLHLSELAQYMRYGFFPKPKWAILEVCDITDDGKAVLTSAVGIAPTAAHLADKIILELNSYHPKELLGMHDVYEPLDPPYRREIPIFKANDRAGSPYLQLDPKKIVGIVETNLPNEIGAFTPMDDVTAKIGQNVADFLSAEMKAGRIPKEFLPVQSGVGNVANAVLAAMGSNPNIPAFNIYTEVIQDSVVGLIRSGRVKLASGSSLSLTTAVLNEVYADLPFFKDKFLLRPSEISNNPEVARRIGIIAINTALEADIFGHVNSSHVLGTKMMNGIGGSGDFCRNAYLSIFTTPSIAKGGAISAIVPMVSHVDHSEHSVKILITEHGVADLRGLSPHQRAESIITHCVDPSYQPLLREYLKLSQTGHTPATVASALSFHVAFAETGDMRQAKFKA